jgi:hypothetical protein
MDIQKQIDAWKKEGHTVLEMPFDDGTTAFFKRPTRKVLKLIMGKGRRGGPIELATLFIKNCYLGGDITQEVLLAEDNTEYFSQVYASIDDLLGTKMQEVKKH